MDDDYYQEEETGHYYDSTYNIERSPNIALYRQPDTVSGEFCERPALLDLHEHKNYHHQHGIAAMMSNRNYTPDNNKRSVPDKVVKLGWGSGVMLRGILSIIGTMLFLRLGFVMGEAGILVGLFIIVFSVMICLSTTLSLSAIATNGLVRGGGAYFLLSRTLGPEWGLVTGVVLSVSNCLAASLCLVGFAETVGIDWHATGESYVQTNYRTILDENNVKYLISEVNDIRLISIIALSLIILIVVASIKYETVFMYILMVMLVVSMINFMVGALLPSNFEKLAKGITGLSRYTLKQNLKPKLTNGISVGQIFGIFFPAMTGVLAGVNISGNLRDPNKAIPKGTLAAILTSALIYILTALVFVSTTLPASDGSVREMFNLAQNASLQGCSLSLDLPMIALICANYTTFNDSGEAVVLRHNLSSTINGTSGLLFDYNIMKSISAYGPLMYAGVFGATLSSASAAFVSAPKVFQALCKDDLLPAIFGFFAVGHPKTDEPHRGYILGFIVIATLNMIGYLNRLAIFVAECTLFCYILINYACSEMCASKSLGWRPRFRWYNKYLSKFTLVVLLGAMFVIDWRYAIFTITIVAVLFLYAKNRNLQNDWGSPAQALLYTRGLDCIQKFVNLDMHVKNFRPQCLVLTGYPSERPHLLHLIRQITGSHNLAICGHVVWREKRSLANKFREIRSAQHWLRDNKYKFFYTQIQARSFREGVSGMMQCAGVGQLRPNIVVIGFKNAYRNLDIIDETLDYFEIIHDAFDLSMSLMIVKLNSDTNPHCTPPPPSSSTSNDEGAKSPSSVRIKTDQREFTIRYDISSNNNNQTKVPSQNDPNLNLHSILHNRPRVHECSKSGRFFLFRFLDHSRRKSENDDDAKEKKTKKHSIIMNTQGVTNFALLNLVKTHTKFIDIWWLYDDGGLSVLLPYLLSQNHKWSSCHLRVYGLSDRDTDMNTYTGMAGLLSLMRIKYDLVKVFDEFDKEQDDLTSARFMDRIKKFMASNDTTNDQPWRISQDDVFKNQSKTLRHVRLANLIREHSKEADVVFVTMMVPRKGSIPSLLYLSWLDLVSESHEAVCFLRGNQENVLTYYM